MKINKLQLFQYRKYDKYSVEFAEGINIICGNNAIGKTTILEAIYHLVTVRSNRAIHDIEVIKENCSEAIVLGEFEGEKLRFFTKVLISNNYKKIIVNNNKVKKASDYIGFVPIVSFNNNDINTLLHSPSSRRKMFDFMLCQIDKVYLNLVKQYKNLIKEKNSLLKKSLTYNSLDTNLLESIDNLLYKIIVDINKKRILFIEKMNELLMEIQAKINSNYEKYYINLRQSFPFGGTYKQFIKTRNEDIKIQSAYIGPHKDDYELYINDKNLMKYASQGQIKMFSILLKLAYAIYLKNEKEKNPIVLLDDLFGELDKKRQNDIINILNKDMQIFITTPTISDINKEILEKANIIYLEKEE